MSTHHKSESEIQQELQQIEAAKKDPLRFGVLYDRYYKQVFVFIHRRTEDEEVAADLTSTVFLKALININKYVFKGVPFSAWLFRIAFNEINMYFRKSNAQRVVSLDSLGLKQIAAETEGESETDPESVKKLMDALKRLSAEDLQMIELRFFEKRSFAEVGTIVGITENNAKVKVYRILDKIRKNMNAK